MPRAKGPGTSASDGWDGGREGVRLQKVLAAAGVASRRASEQLIVEGRVEVDGQVVTELGTRVDPEQSTIRVDGSRVHVREDTVTVAFNKPRHVVSTMDDPEGRPTLADFVGNRYGRLFHVGRLDFDSEGLILLTSDGTLSQRLTHPSYEVPKTYVATVTGHLRESVGRRLRSGIELEDGPASIDHFHIVEALPKASLIEVTLHSGRNRIVRRMFDAVGHPVERLVRTEIGPIKLGDLKPGRSRVLGHVELASLERAVGL